jgi:hypothetical protein
MTPFLWLIVTAFAAFIVVLGTVSLWTSPPAPVARTKTDRSRAQAQALVHRRARAF